MVHVFVFVPVSPTPSNGIDSAVVQTAYNTVQIIAGGQIQIAGWHTIHTSPRDTTGRPTARPWWRLPLDGWSVRKIKDWNSIMRFEI